jgi:hypothetical protein
MQWTYVLTTVLVHEESFHYFQYFKPNSMFDQLLDLVKQNAGSAIINNPAIPNERNDDAVNTTGQSIMNSLSNQAGSGNMNQLLEMFQSGNTQQSNPVVNNVTKNVAGDLAQKFNLNSSQASGIAEQLIPVVMNQLVSKTNNPQDSSFTMDGIMKAVGSNTDLGSLAKNLFKF